VATPRVTWAQALAWRMERQFLDPLGAATPLEIVRRLCGVQAQVASSAELAVRLRRREATDTDVAAALSDGLLVKTWAMRGTLHLLPADEAGVFLALLAAGRSWETPAWERYFGLTPAQIEGLRDIVRNILDGRVLTREEVNAQIVQRPGYEHLADELKSGWGTLFKPLAWQGDIVFGPNRGTRVTFARPEQLTRHWRPVPAADEAAPRAIRAYLRAYGPANPAHVKRFVARGRVSGRTLKHWFAELGDSVAGIDVEGEPMFVAAEDVDAIVAKAPSSTVRLLAGFDQWVLGPGTEDAHVIPPGRRWQVSRTAGWIAPTVVVGGVVCGTWALTGDRVEVEWFSERGWTPLAGLESEVERLALLVGRPLVLAVAQSRPPVS